ncbi:MAG TPA: FecR domain-containing protein [Kofleriaceae bacterium]
MNERLEQARRLGGRITPGWEREDIEAQLVRLNVRRRRRARRAIAIPLGAVAIATAVVALVGRGGAPLPGYGRTAPELAEHAPPAAPREVAVVAPVPPPAPAEPPAASGVLSLGDGSVVTPLGAASRLLARRVSDTDVVVALAGGAAQFDVPDRAARRFRAELGSLALETHGAAFRVRIARREVEVAAERGEVSARWGRERHVIAAGETRTFAVAAHDEIAHAAPGEPVPAPEPPSTWRDDAGRGDYQAAWAGLARVPAPADMADLLLAGDVARLSGHPDAAVASLARAIELHADDPRAPLAAFTLGRVHLEDLGAPRSAALAFARARDLAPDGPLAEDALAREVEAWSRAGEAELARTRALGYAERYPTGRRVRAVRRFGGLERP